VKERDWDAWQPAAIPISQKDKWNLDTLNLLLSEPFLSPNNLESRALLTNSQELVVVKTNYKPSSNSKKIYPKDNTGRFQFTEKQ